MSTTFATLRRTLAQRMDFWGGDISGDSAGSVESATNNTLVDTTRPEPDDEWDSSWIVLNPGSSTNVIWRRVAPDSGWIQSNGTFTIVGTWPAPYSTSGPPQGTPYEVYKVFKPVDWLKAVNYALTRSYPSRHRAADFEIPQSYYSRILDWGRLAKQVNTVPTPTASLTLSEIADGQGAFQPGTYAFTYTYYNDFGETLQGPTTNITIVGTNSRVSIGQVNSVPGSVSGINFYSSIQPNDLTVLDMVDLGQSVIVGIPNNFNIPLNATYVAGMNVNGTVYGLQIATPNPWFGVAPPSYNTTSVDFYRLHHILKRMNPGQFPEVWRDLQGDLWKPLGGTKLMLMEMPISQFSLKLVCTTSVPTLSADTDVTQEPTELIYAGAEAYLWNLLTKTSTIVNVNWKQLHDAAWADYLRWLDQYAQETPRDVLHRPVVRVQY